MFLISTLRDLQFLCGTFNPYVPLGSDYSHACSTPTVDTVTEKYTPWNILQNSQKSSQKLSDLLLKEMSISLRCTPSSNVSPNSINNHQLGVR